MVKNETVRPESTKMPELVIEITNLSKGFDDSVKNLSLKLYDGENLVVLGKSGLEKSVLIKCIVRLLNPDQEQFLARMRELKTRN